MTRLRYLAPLALAVVLVVLAGCGGDPAPPAAGGTPTPTLGDQVVSPSPSLSPSLIAPTTAASPSPTSAWTPCDNSLQPYEGGCETDFIIDSCDASLYSQEAGGLLDAYIENKVFVDAKRLQDCPQFLPVWKKALTGFSDGSWEVGKDVKAGTYETTAHLTDGQVRDCYWERGTSGGRRIANDFVTAAKKVRVTIRSSDGMFTSEGCGNWVKV